MSPLDDVVREFLIESRENLDQLDRDLVRLEQSPRNAEVLASIFRNVHTIKGSCGFFDFPRLGAIAHAGENLLSRLRDGQLVLTPALTSGLLALGDAIRARLDTIEKTGAEGDAPAEAIVERLTRLLDGEPAPMAAESEPRGGEAAEERARADSTIRVDVVLLDKLMNLVGELVLARNQALQHAAALKDAALQGTTQRLNLITTELQEGVMKTRMQPIANVWNKFPRLARDVALTCGKRVRLTLEGATTELDKSIIEAIQGPLTHLLRNSIDHGIEAAETRQGRGKPAEGHVVLRAFHEGGQVIIEVSDDGGGIDPGRILARALERGLVTREQAGAMTERELLQLIFLPGFSTAEKVTAVSGRGVGMDVVKSNIEKIAGSVDLQSRPGLGTTVRIKIPLTLAIIPALLVRCAGDAYAIPQASLLELVRLEPRPGEPGIEYVHGAPVYRLRGRLLPLVFLDRELGVARAEPGEAVNLVVLRADGRSFGLVVDGVSDTEEIVVKPLGKLLKGLPVYAGATILGDGRVALILDVLGLAQRARVVAETRERGLPAVRKSSHTELVDARGLLIVGLGEARLAIPLPQVARLEELAASAVERAGGREAVQYRGEVLPLVRLGDVLGAAGPPDGGPLKVVVHTARGRSVGLVVDRIHDIIETEAVERPVETGGHGVRGSAVLQGRLTDLLDVEDVLCSALPGWGEKATWSAP